MRGRVIRMSNIPEPSEFPEVTTGRRWVAIRWHDNGAYHVYTEEGTLQHRWTLPSFDGTPHAPLLPES